MRNLENIVKTAIIIFVSVIPTSIWAQAEEKPHVMQYTTCERKVTPDELYLSITINEKDNKGKKSLEDLQSSMITALQRLGINVEKALTLNFMGSEISYTTFKRNINPRTNASYTLKLDNANTMQEVIAHLEAIDITNIQLVKTKYSKADDIYNELGIEAMVMAKKQAETLAGAIGQSIGPALSINSNRYSSESNRPRLYKARNTAIEESATSDSYSEPQIEIGEITFSVNVTVKFLLKE